MYTLNERNFSHVQRARALLNNWRAALDCLSEYRWVFKGSSSLFYVNSESREFDRWTIVNTLTDTFFYRSTAIRFLEGAEDKLVYGLDDDMTQAEVFWPQTL
jgi:hypothetical protein